MIFIGDMIVPCEYGEHWVHRKVGGALVSRRCAIEAALFYLSLPGRG